MAGLSVWTTWSLNYQSDPHLPFLKMTSRPEVLTHSEQKETIAGFILSSSGKENQDPAAPLDKDFGDIIDQDYVSHEKSLVRKLDMTLMPTIFLLYLLNYLDRNNIACDTSGPTSSLNLLICLPSSQAKLDSIESDLGLKGNDYNVAISVLSIG